jgi:SAM-dependent methyltransferase
MRGSAGFPPKQAAEEWEVTMAASIEAHNQKPAATWSSGGGAYDEVSHQISSALEHCVVRLDSKADEKVLDLATGTGWTSRLEARRGAKVTGADIAEDLLADARARAAAENLAIEYKIGDAEKLPFGDGEFDAISSTFGVMFVSRPEAAAAEIARVCRSGGRLAMTTWLPDSSVFKMFQVMRPYMAPPPNPAPPSPFAWGRQDRIRELFGSNFDVRFETGVTNYYDRSGQDAWNKFVTGYGPTKALAASLDEARRKDLQRDFVNFHDGFKTELGFCLPREYLLTFGLRR